MITEPEMAEDPDLPQAARSAEDVVGAEDGRRRAGRPWPWMLGTAVATCAVGALVLHAVGYGRAHTPDLHGYHAVSPCEGDNLKPLADAFHASTQGAGPADQESGPAIDALQCGLVARGPVDRQWTGAYTVVATVVLHKKTDPTAEFEDLAQVHGSVVDPFGAVGTAGITRSVPIPGMGDEAFLLTRDDSLSLTVRHGGAVFALRLDASQALANPAAPLTDANGYPVHAPSLSRFEPALEQSMARIMAALAK